jgi:hypothetical protein
MDTKWKILNAQPEAHNLEKSSVHFNLFLQLQPMDILPLQIFSNGVINQQDAIISFYWSF